MLINLLISMDFEICINNKRLVLNEGYNEIRKEYVMIFEYGNIFDVNKTCFDPILVIYDDLTEGKGLSLFDFKKEVSFNMNLINIDYGDNKLLH